MWDNLPFLRDNFTIIKQNLTPIYYAGLGMSYEEKAKYIETLQRAIDNASSYFIKRDNIVNPHITLACSKEPIDIKTFDYLEWDESRVYASDLKYVVQIAGMVGEDFPYTLYRDSLGGTHLAIVVKTKAVKNNYLYFKDRGAKWFLGYPDESVFTPIIPLEYGTEHNQASILTLPKFRIEVNFDTKVFRKFCLSENT